MTKKQIARVCKTIEDLQETGIKYSTMKTLFTDEALNLFDEKVFECAECGRKVPYIDLVNADEMTIDDICDGFCTCAECVEQNNIYGFSGVYTDGFADLFSDAVELFRELKNC